jgi:hypothetical protein
MLVAIGRHPFVPLAAMVVARIAAAILLPLSSRKTPFSRGVRLSVLLFIVAVIANFVVGDAVANRLIEAGGEDGQAVVTSTRTLNETYNYHDVTEYILSLRTADGRSVRVSTRSDEFNIASGRRIGLPAGGGDAAPCPPFDTIRLRQVLVG